jgi:hypothetical protein
MAQSTDPEVRKYDNQGESVTCTQCYAFMLPLRDYEISKSSESPAIEAELWEFLLWGWWAFVGNYLHSAMTYKSRQSKLAQMKQEVLPRFPRSLVCPRCLHILQRP